MQETCVRYMCLVYAAEDFGPSPDQVREFVTFRQEALDAGVYLEAGQLRPAETSTTLRSNGGEVMLTDGPFAEIKEQLGGFVLLECRDLDEALTWARRIPGLRDGGVEVRPMVEFPR